MKGVTRRRPPRSSAHWHCLTLRPGGISGRGSDLGPGPIPSRILRVHSLVAPGTAATIQCRRPNSGRGSDSWQSGRAGRASADAAAAGLATRYLM